MNLSRASIGAITAVWIVSTVLWLTPGLTRPDGVAYFLYMPSTLFDRDLLFFDEWAQTGLIRDGQLLFKDVTETQHLSNHWTVGTSLAWYPAFLVAELVARLQGAGGSGFSVGHITAAAFTSAVAGLLMMLAGASLARRWFSERASTAAAIAIWFGSPLAWYSLRHSTMSHAISALVCAGVVMLSLRLRDHPSRTTLLALGLALGYACAVRPQNILIGIVPLLVSPIRPLLRQWHVVLLGGLIGGLPQIVVSQFIYGGPLVFVNIGGRAHGWQMFSTFRPLETIVTWWHGMATWTPLVLVAIAGFALIYRKDRGLGRAAIAAFCAQWLALSILERWFWGGASFGQRRFDSITIFFILGLAAVFDTLPRWLSIVIAALTTLWTMGLFIAAGEINLNRFQLPPELFEAFLRGLERRAWITPLGYLPHHFRGTVFVTVLAIAPLLAMLLWAAWRGRRFAVPVATCYLLAMSAFLVWCGMHPKFDRLAAGFIVRDLRGELTSAGARDTIGLLRDEAEYMRRVGRTEEAEAALREAAAIRP